MGQIPLFLRVDRHFWALDPLDMGQIPLFLRVDRHFWPLEGV